MQYTKILGLLAIAAAGVMALSESASATTITSFTGTASTPFIHFVNEGGHVTLENPEGNLECTTTIEAQIKSHGAGLTAEAEIGHIDLTGCTGARTITFQAYGSFEFHWTSGYNATLTWSGMTMTAVRHTIFGTIECRYRTNNTTIGTLTGGNPATIHLEAQIPFHGGSTFCNSGTAAWTGSIVTTSSLYVDS